MKNAASLREQIRSSMSARAAMALTPHVRPRPEQISCGITAIDELLHGGLPTGSLTELVGTECSGRTTTALTYVATVTQAGGVCAWIDATDALEPESAAASGVDLYRLLWVRCGTNRQIKDDTISEALVTASALTEVRSKPHHTGGGSPHPRSEGRDMPHAIGALLQAHGGLYDKQIRREKKAIGTPGMPNRLFSERSQEREEQTNRDRLPPRRGDNLLIAPQCAEPQPKRFRSLTSCKPHPSNILRAARIVPEKPWKALDQALRTTDLLLQSGGFSVIVLDLASAAPEFVWRIPLATWFRFRAACERTRISLVLLTQHPCARSSAELVVRLQTGSFEDSDSVMTGIRYRAATERSRCDEIKSRIVPIRKPPQSESAGQWNNKAAWARSR